MSQSSENIAIAISHRERTWAAAFNVTASPEEQDKAWEYAKRRGWDVKDVPVIGHPASALPTVAAYDIEVSLEDWREWKNNYDQCVEAMFGDG